MGACVHRPKKPIAAPAVSAEVSNFLSYVRPLDLIVYSGADKKSIDMVEIAITAWWRDHRRPSIDIGNHIDKPPPPIQREAAVMVDETVSDSEGSEGLSSIDRPAISLNVSPRESIVRADHPDNIADESSIATGGKRMVDVTSPTKLYAWGGDSATPCVRQRALGELAQAYIDHPNANIGVCRMVDNPTVIGPYEPEYRFDVRANNIRGQLSRAQEAFLDGREPNLTQFVSAMFPSLSGIAAADDMIIERFMRNNSWLRHSMFAATVYNTLGYGGNIDENGSINVGPVTFSGEYLVGSTEPMLDLPPYWASASKNDQIR